MLQTSMAHANDVLRRLASVQFEMERRLMEMVNEDLSLNAPMLIILGRLYKSGAAVLPSDLIRKGFYVGTNVAYNVSRLEDGEYIKRETIAADKRVKPIALTEKGKAVGKKVSEAIETLDKGIGMRFPKEEAEEAYLWLISQRSG